MVKPSWGSKRTCTCGIRFYDLNKKEIECPGCGETVNIELLSTSILENNLRKKPQSEVIEEAADKNFPKEDKNAPKTKGSEGTEIETDEDDTKEAAEEIVGDKIKKKDKEE